MKKYEKVVDDAQFLKLKNEAMEASRHVLTGIEALKNEGIPTDEKTIKMLTASPEALENFIRDSANNQIGKGFVPPEEKSRIYKVYSELLARINSKVQTMRECLPTVPVVFNGEDVEIDTKTLEKIALEKATQLVDVEGITEYYSKVQAVEKAMNELREYEIQKDLPDFLNRGLSYSENQFFYTSKLLDFLRNDSSFEKFKKIAKRSFLKK
jgi:S-adenosylmethionine synthetase